MGIAPAVTGRLSKGITAIEITAEGIKAIAVTITAITIITMGLRSTFTCRA